MSMPVEVSDERKSLITAQLEKALSTRKKVAASESRLIQLETYSTMKSTLLRLIDHIVFNRLLTMSEMGMEDKAKEIISQHSKPKEQQPAA